jgi:hypothetical protein
VRRRNVVLAATGVAAVAVAIVIVVTGRKHESPERAAVTQYIKDVDRLQQEQRASLTGAGLAYRNLAIGKPLPAARQRELVAAEATLRKLRDRVIALPAPAVAHRLKALLVQLAQRQVAVAHEVNEVAVFVPRYVVLLQQVRATATELGRALAAVPTVKVLRAHGTKAQIAAATAAHNAEVAHAASVQADAIDAYVASMRAISRRSNAVAAPSVLRPVYDAEARAIAASVVAGTALSVALRSTTRADVPARSRDFAEATRSAGAVSVQRAEIAAIKAYDGRIRAIGKVQDRIRLEIGRVDAATS